MAKVKDERLAAVREVVMHNQVGSQEELQNLLLGHGYKVTQATLSRDIKRLKIAKVPDLHGGYRYMLQDQHATARIALANSGEDVISKGVKSIEFSGAIAVIKTKSGYASIVADQIDTQKIKDVIGTLAGDDTVLLVVRENTQRIDLLRNLTAVIPNIQSRLI